MDRLLVKHPYAIDTYIVDFSSIMFAKKMDRLLDKHPDAFNTFNE